MPSVAEPPAVPQPARGLWWRRVGVAVAVVVVVGLALWPLLSPGEDVPGASELATHLPSPASVAQPSDAGRDTLAVAQPAPSPTAPEGSHRPLLALAGGEGSPRAHAASDAERLATQVSTSAPSRPEGTASVADAHPPSGQEGTSLERLRTEPISTPAPEEEHVVLVPRHQPAQADLLDIEVPNYPEPTPSEPSSAWSTSMYTRGQLPTGQSRTSTGGMPMLSKLSSMDGGLRLFASRDASSEPTRVLGFTDDPQFSFRHRAPLRMGLSLAYALSERLSLQTGVVYSLLRSDYSVSHSHLSVSGQQELHYLGVPLGVSYRLISLGRLGLYSSVGTMVEKCLYGYMRSRSQAHSDVRRPDYTPEERNFQWSVRASLGLEYRLSGGLHLFVEPQVSYYLDNGSLIKSYYKEHPLSFDFQLGFRWTLPGGSR